MRKTTVTLDTFGLEKRVELWSYEVVGALLLICGNTEYTPPPPTPKPAAPKGNVVLVVAQGQRYIGPVSHTEVVGAKQEV